MSDQPAPEASVETPKTYVIVIEGQNIPVGPEIGATDEAVKAALTGFFPEAANAMISRVERNGVVTVNVVKRAGTKGNDNPLVRLAACHGGMNPIIVLYQQVAATRLEDLPPDQMLALNDQIEAAIEAGQKAESRIESAFKRLQAARPQPSPVMVSGF